jgi:mannitol/fructose-specific phosphotransferase system IIA component (Ntr-type)
LLLTDLITPGRIKIPLEGRTKDEILEELVELATGDGGIDDVDAVLRAVRDREAVLSTGIGHGVGIPHGRSAAVRELRMAAGVTAMPVDFDALDGQPVRLFFILIGPETAAAAHIKALSRISRLVRRDDIRERLITVDSPEEFYQILNDFEGL